MAEGGFWGFYDFGAVVFVDDTGEEVTCDLSELEG